MSQALASDSSWNVDAAGTWITPGNWTAGVPGIAAGSDASASADIATFSFPLTLARIVTLDANRNVGGITFGNTSSFGYTITGSSTIPLRLSSGGVIQNLTATGPHTDALNAPVIIQGNGGTATFTANAISTTSALTIGAVSSNLISGISTAGNVTTLTLNGTNTNIANVAGILTDGTAGGKLALIKDGSGTWTIGFASNLATFTGGITINAGTLRSAISTAGQALGSANAVTLANTAGAILDISTAAQTIGSLAGGGTTGGNVTLANSIILTLGLDNSNTVYAGAISGGTGGITKIGTGTQTLSGTNSYTGATRLNGGTLALDFSASPAPVTNIIAATSLLNLAGGTLSLTGKASTENSQTFASTTLTAGNASAVSLAANATTNPLLLNLGAITRGAGTTLDLTLPSGAQNTTNGVRTSTTNTVNAVFTTSANIASTTIGGTTWAGRTGTLTQNLVPFTDAGGSYSTGNANYTSTRHVDVTDGDAPTANFTVSTLRFNGNQTLTLSGDTNVVSTGGILVTSAATTGARITGGTLRSSGTAAALQLINYGTQLTVDSVITDNGATPAVVTLAGPGTTILNGANLYTGATYITGGTVKIGTSSALGVGSAVTISDKASAVLDLNGFDLAIGSLAGGGGQGTNGQGTLGTSGGTVALGSKTLTVGTTSNTVFGGNITGLGGSLIKVGSGDLTLHGANTFTGGVTVKSGAIAASGVIGNNAFGTGTITLGDSNGGSAPASLRVGSTLGVVGIYNFSNAIVLAPNTTGLLDVNTSSSSGSMILSGGVTGPNNFRINSAVTGGGSTIAFTTLPINNSGTLTVGGSTTNTNISITGGIGSNVTDVFLIRNNTLGTSNNGITISSVAGSTVNNTGLISNTGTAVQSNTISAPIGINVTGVTQNSATASLTLGGANTFRGPLTVLQGILTLGTSVQAAGINSAVSLANVSGAVINITTTAQNFGSLAGGGGAGGNVNLNNAAASNLTIGSDHTSTTYSGLIGGTAPTAALRKIGTGTLSLTNASALAGGTTAINGTLLLDYASVDPQGAGALTLSGGQFTFKGNAAGTTTDTVGTVTTITNSRSGIAVQNNAVITTGAWTSGGSANPVLVDLSSGATSTLKTTTAFATADSASAAPITLNGIVMLGSTTVGAKRANLYVQDAAGIGFATQNTANEIVRYTSATDLVAGIDEGTATTNMTNYKVSEDLTRSVALNFQTLEINTAGDAVTLAMGGNALTANGSGRSILVTGNNNAAITSTGGVITGSNLLNLANYGTGTTTLAMNLVSNALVKNGSGLVVYSGNVMTGDTHVTEGTLRFATALDYSTNVVRIYGGGIFELGADLNGGATAGDFSKPVANATNGVALVGDGGFSAHGADRTVNLGGALTPTGLTWGSAFFLADPAAGSVDNDYIFKIGSATSTNTLEFVNPIALGVRQRFLEVADGTSGTNVDGKLSGVLSGTGGITKTGAGTLELTVANTYTGPTNVNAGTLIVTGSLAVTTADLTVADDAVLSGTGAIGSDGVINGDLRIGANAANNSVGTLSFTDAGASTPGVSFGSTGTWWVDLVQGTNSSDRLVVEGLMAIAPGAVLSFNMDTASPYSTSSIYTIATYGGSRTGAFSGISEGQTLMIGGGAYFFSYGTGSGSAITLTAVPEPGTLGLLGMGIVGLALRRYRRKRAGFT